VASARPANGSEGVAPNRAGTPIAPLGREHDLDTPSKATSARGTWGPSCPCPADDAPCARRSGQCAGAPRGPHQDGRARAHRPSPHLGRSSRPPATRCAVHTRLGREPWQRDRSTPRPRHCAAGPARPTTGTSRPSCPSCAPSRSPSRSSAALPRPCARSPDCGRAGPARPRYSRRRAPIPNTSVNAAARRQVAIAL
jgi:hypothetical protein